MPVNAGGVYGYCMAWDGGETFAFQNGTINSKVCFAKIRKYFKNRSATWTAKHYDYAVLIVGDPLTYR